MHFEQARINSREGAIANIDFLFILSPETREASIPLNYCSMHLAGISPVSRKPYIITSKTKPWTGKTGPRR
jgi:hypothetical protein